MICQNCDGSGWIEVELEPGPGERHDPGGRGEIRCSVCNWRPGDPEPEEIAEMMDAVMQVEIDEAWADHERRRHAEVNL